MAVIDPPGSATAVVNPKSRTASETLQTRKPASIFSIPFITIPKLTRANTAILSTAQSEHDRRDSRHGTWPSSATHGQESKGTTHPPPRGGYGAPYPPR
jgi:hypothetical protein